jgi:hypothetical protein
LETESIASVRIKVAGLQELLSNEFGRLVANDAEHRDVKD